ASRPAGKTQSLSVIKRTATQLAIGSIGARHGGWRGVVGRPGMEILGIRVPAALSQRTTPPLPQPFINSRRRYSPPIGLLSWLVHSRLRSTNFWILPVEVFGSGPNSIVSGHL